MPNWNADFPWVGALCSFAQLATVIALTVLFLRQRKRHLRMMATLERLSVMLLTLQGALGVTPPTAQIIHLDDHRP